uniref:Uncharacterized protein n=1 Tax=Pipistrellus kuhlii TaxID=59472 RepID=A0A7J7VBV9_PIPKU|nr:hypothetical protein mPipKuh1_008508 [Pipistrellus kuhlii]
MFGLIMTTFQREKQITSLGLIFSIHGDIRTVLLKFLSIVSHFKNLYIHVLGFCSHVYVENFHTVSPTQSAPQLQPVFLLVCLTSPTWYPQIFQNKNEGRREKINIVFSCPTPSPQASCYSYTLHHLSKVSEMLSPEIAQKKPQSK